MTAVLADAIDCALRRKPGVDPEHVLALEWFDDGEQAYLYSFERICQELSLEPTAVRVALRKRMAQDTLPQRRVMSQDTRRSLRIRGNARRSTPAVV